MSSEISQSQPEFQSQIQNIGQDILKRMEGQSKGSLFSKDYWYGSIMDWSMKNESFKTQMFRFVDVLPYLNSGGEVARHLKEYFADSGEQLPSVFNVGLGLGSLAPGLMAGAIRKNVTSMAKMFIVGENPEEALSVIKKARKNKMTFTADLLGETTLSEKEALEYQSKYLELIDGLTKDAERWDEIPQIDRDHETSIPKVNVSVKLTALYSQIKDTAWEESKKHIKDRLRPIFDKAMQKKAFVNVDMEHYGVKHMTIEIFEEIIMEPAYKDYPFFGIVIQAYLRDSLEDTRRMVNLANKRNVPFSVRLVKGAYWDSETIEAEQKRWPIPVYLKKAESDANYEVCTEELMKAFPKIRVAVASHNVRSISNAIATAAKYKIPMGGFEFQMLYGMGEPIKKSLVDMGYRVREYAPVGDLIPGMGYLVRRLLENTSNDSWLRGKFADGLSTEKLLQDPKVGLQATSPLPKTEPRFYNDAPLDFAIQKNRDQMTTAITNFRKRLPISCPVIINGEETASHEIITRENPARPAEVLGHISLASTADADKAIDIARKAFTTWKNTTVESRARLLEKLADKMDEKRFDLMATQVLEVGKPWAEADGEVGEAIDFCRYYARDMRRLAKAQKVGNIPGEVSLYHYQPRGVALVIAPWNFPFAILAGMVTAALVTGNTVVMKPAEQSSLIALDLMRLMQEVGFPKDVCHFLPGLGEQVGAHMVESPYVTNIAFTGSKDVGLAILKSAMDVKPKQTSVKKCIIEMGGKNAIIVDSDADLDVAVDGVLYSAFGYSGQKCSACSRVIVLDEIYEKFESRLLEAAKSIHVHESENPDSYFGPVVDSEAQLRIMRTIEDAKKKHELLFEGEVPATGYFVPPTIFKNVDPNSDLAQKEIFGPVLAIIPAKDLNQAIQIANETEYGLTGGLYSRSPANIDRVKKEFEVGNLYINRGITGAMVDRHPFGGFKMSGIGSKTGGPDYLQQFMEPRAVTENTVRRGFAPPEENQ